MTHSRTPKSIVRKAVIITGWVLLGILAMAAFALVFGYVVMLLWNWLMPAIFGLATIDFWQAVGIVILAKLLFGGFGSHRAGGKSHKMKSRFKERCAEKGFSKWRHYEKFWQEEGKTAYEAYLAKKDNAE